ncbi:MAG: hypothetical protein ACI4JM_06665 [Oscillospiraceae bacterium]
MQISGNISDNGCVSGNIRCISSAGNDYNNLKNKPTINNFIIAGDMSLEDIGIYPMSDDEIDSVIDERSMES